MSGGQRGNLIHCAGMDFQLPIFGFPPVLSLQLTTLAGLLTLASALVHVAFAIGIYADAKRLDSQGQEAYFAPPWVWGLAVLVMGLPLVVFYWLAHHSTWRAAGATPVVKGTAQPETAVPPPVVLTGPSMFD
jgi:hypothetical protein